MKQHENVNYHRCTGCTAVQDDEGTTKVHIIKTKLQTSTIKQRFSTFPDTKLLHDSQPNILEHIPCYSQSFYNSACGISPHFTSFEGLSSEHYWHCQSYSSGESFPFYQRYGGNVDFGMSDASSLCLTPGSYYHYYGNPQAASTSSILPSMNINVSMNMNLDLHSNKMYHFPIYYDNRQQCNYHIPSYSYNPTIFNGSASGTKLVNNNLYLHPNDNICCICNKLYARPSTLKTHMRTHSGERPYSCSVCLKSFSQTANLRAHLRTHSGEKPYPCRVCNRKFSQSSSVTTHMRVHSGERPYRCRMCRKCFSDSSTLTKHSRIHSGEKPYRCKICQLGFSQSGNLNRHMRVHEAL